MLLAAVVLISVSSARHVYTDKSVAEWMGNQLNDLPGIINGGEIVFFQVPTASYQYLAGALRKQERTLLLFEARTSQCTPRL